ncbi:hypothetical protein JB92DRAFT_849151 [Gautieria morchelliformis]|nr:hypothetical protein JB92DRAFT_849151 [Gautieria morchelliformis]
MGDVFAAIREKSQAHQEESRAKRLRDRGGLWQPLSPSKNKLMAFLNSEEFQNIEESLPAERNAELSKAPETPQKSTGKMKAKATSTSRSKRKSTASSGIHDRPANSVEELELVSARPKKKSKSNVCATINPRDRRKAADTEPRRTESPPPSDSNLSRSLPAERKRKVPGMKATQKRRLTTIDEGEPIVVTETTVGKPQLPITNTNDDGLFLVHD